MQQFDQYVKLNKKIPPEILTSIVSIDDTGRLADTIAAHLPLVADAGRGAGPVSLGGEPKHAD
jgi:ATP-dependent Lon protease